MTLHKSFIRVHLDYGDIIYDQSFNNSLQNKIESIEYNASLAIIDPIRRTCKESLYEELRLEPVQHRYWYWKLYYLDKIVVNKSPHYLFKVVPDLPSNTFYNTRNTNDITLKNIKHNLKNTFFTSTIIEWNKLDSTIQNSTSFN